MTGLNNQGQKRLYSSPYTQCQNHLKKIGKLLRMSLFPHLSQFAMKKKKAVDLLEEILEGKKTYEETKAKKSFYLLL